MIPKFKKPKPTNENQPKEKQTKLHPMYKKHLKSIPTDSSVMKQLDLDKLSRDYVLAHEKLTILSLEYVIEHGASLSDGELWWDRDYGYYISDHEGIYFTGLLYSTYDDLHLKHYAFYEDGVENGVKIRFYSSGEVLSYGVYSKGEIIGIYHEWYESGMIKKVLDHIQNKRFEFDENGNIIRSNG